MDPLRSYDYVFSGQKLAKSVIGLPLGSGPVTAAVPAAKDIRVRQDVQSTQVVRGVVLVHGLLCSRLDMAHIAEGLARQGFTVVAPEMFDSVSHDEGVVPGGFVGELLAREQGEARRRDVVEEALAWLRARGASAVGLVGHSRGGVTVSQVEGSFCRVNIAGFQPPQVNPRETFAGTDSSSPMLVICGTDDEVCTRGPLSLDYVQETVQRLVPHAETWYPNAGHFTVLDPRVVTQWRQLLGPLGAAAPAPASEPFAKELAERVVSWLDTNVV